MEAKYEAMQINERLEGGKIIETFTSPDDEYFGFKVKKGRKTFKVWVDGDSEGNHCGHLSIEEEPKK